MPFTRFDRYVDRHARTFTERLQALCRMPSVAARGTGMRAVAEMVEQMLQRTGAGTRVFRVGSGYPIVYGECGAGERLHAHEPLVRQVRLDGRLAAVAVLQRDVAVLAALEQAQRLHVGGIGGGA